MSLRVFRNHCRTFTSVRESSKRLLSKYQSYHPPRLHNKVAIITGASSGLGRAIALQYASHDTKLVICADLRPEPRLNEDETVAGSTHEVINEVYGDGKAVFVKADVNDSRAVENAVRAAVEGAGRVDILVNSAGLGNVSGSPPLHELNEEDWDRVLNVNLRGTFITNKYVLRQMMKQEPEALSSASNDTSYPPPGTTSRSSISHVHDIGLLRRGIIINISSMLGTIALPDGTGAYCASKGGVLNLTRQLALDYAPYLINVNALCPGFLETAMTAGNRRTVRDNPIDEPSERVGENLKLKGNNGRATAEQTGERMRCATPFGEWGKAEDVARMAVSLASEDGAWVTGAEVVVDGGYSAGGFGGVAAVTDPRNLRWHNKE